MEGKRRRKDNEITILTRLPKAFDNHLLQIQKKCILKNGEKELKYITTFA